jgi:hypothetical protein
MPSHVNPLLLPVVFCTLFALAPARASATVAASPALGTYLVAVGDGYSQGYLTPDLPADPQCQAPDAPGYVCIFYRYLRQLNPGLQIENYSEEGADSCELSGAGHRCFEPAAVTNPLDGAVGFISQHPGQVSPIVLSVGGSDLLPLLQTGLADPIGTAAQLPVVLNRLETNVGAVLGRLRAAAGPDAEIIVTTQIDPLDGVPSPPLPAGIPELAGNAVSAVNVAITTAAAAHNAIVADAAGAFHAHAGGPASLTWVATSLASGDASKLNPYPTPDGYKVFADTVVKASGYVVPLVITAALSSKTVSIGKSDKVRGKATLEASLRVTVRVPNGKQTAGVAAPGASGDYAVSFKVGKTRGRGWVKVCATDLGGDSKCSAKLTYTVR